MIYAENILICIAAPLLISLLFIHGKVRLYTVFFCFGMGICLISAYINGFFSLMEPCNAETTAFYISPVVEEIMKFLPLLFYVIMFRPKYIQIFMAAIALGTGFATFENCCYILSSGADKIQYVLIRGFSTGVMHLVCMLALALGIELVLWLDVLSFPAILGVLSLSGTYHALFNLLLSKPGITSTVGYIMPIVVAAVLYLPYKRIRIMIMNENNESTAWDAPSERSENDTAEHSDP